MRNNWSRAAGRNISRPALAPALLYVVLVAPNFLPQQARAQTAPQLNQEILFNISQGTPLEAALIKWAHATGMQIMMSTTAVAHRTVPAMHGKFLASDLLATLLHGSGLTYTVDGATLHVIARIASPSIDPQRSHPSTPREPDPAPGGRQNSTTVTPALQLPHPGAVAFPQTLPQLQEIVVTAEKRAEDIQEVPMSMTALTSSQLASAGNYQFQDYVGTVPGLVLIDDGSLGSQLVIRGLTSGGTAVNSPVAVYIDNTPYTAAGPWAGSFLIAPNLDTFDMKRIEVLRGPQGTLYGAQALGGLLKYVTNPPVPDHFAATLETGGTSIYNGTAGYDVHGMLNLPIGSTAAIRLVGYDRQASGFIDDPSRNQQRINGTHFSGGRASILYDPIAPLSLRLTALYQRRSWSDNGNEDVTGTTLTPLYGQLIQERVVGQPGYSTTELYNLSVDYRLGFATLLSSTSDTLFRDSGIVDYSNEFGALVTTILGAPYGMADNYQPHDRSFTQEIRLTSPSYGPLDWQVGGFYTNQRGADVEQFWPTDLALHHIVYNLSTNLGSAVAPVRYRESAGYADIRYHFSEALDIGLGGRYSSNTQRFQEIASGVFFGPTNILTSSSEDDFTYSADIRWRPSKEQMIYSRVATGYQPGGPNDVPLAAPGASRSYASSTATSYEMGLKSTLFDNHFLADVDIFDVDWRRIQIEAVIGGFNTFTNGASARSTGAEWQFEYLQSSGITISANGAYTHAYLTQPTPASVNGHTGDRLPGTPLLSASASASYTHALTGALSGDAAFTWRYTGSRFSDFTAVGARQEMPSYDILDFRTGLIAPKWAATLYIKNLTNARAIDYVRPETLVPNGPQSAVLYPPRTIGLAITYHF